MYSATIHHSIPCARPGLSSQWARFNVGGVGTGSESVVERNGGMEFTSSSRHEDEDGHELELHRRECGHDNQHVHERVPVDIGSWDPYTVKCSCSSSNETVDTVMVRVGKKKQIPESRYVCFFWWSCQVLKLLCRCCKWASCSFRWSSG